MFCIFCYCYWTNDDFNCLGLLAISSHKCEWWLICWLVDIGKGEEILSVWWCSSWLRNSCSLISSIFYLSFTFSISKCLFFIRQSSIWYNLFIFSALSYSCSANNFLKLYLSLILKSFYVSRYFFIYTRRFLFSTLRLSVYEHKRRYYYSSVKMFFLRVEVTELSCYISDIFDYSWFKRDFFYSYNCKIAFS